MIETLRGDSSASAANVSSAPHVLLIVDQLPKVLGGGERIVLRTAAMLQDYGYRASILTFDSHPETSALGRSPCPVYLLPLKRTYDWTALRGAFELTRFLHQRRVRIVQTFFESSDLWAGMVAKSFSRAKLVWSRRDMGILRSHKHEVAYRLMGWMPDAVFAVSEGVRQHCINVDGIDPIRVRTIYNGLDPVRWKATPKEKRDGLQPITVSTLGNIRRVKGHDVLVRAAAAVLQEHPDVLFSIAGGVLEPDYFIELEELVKSLGIAEHVRFCGPVKDPLQHLARADIFVLPSRSEGFSNAIIEAMAVSLPVIATNVGGNAEAVEDGVSGYIIPPENSAALASAIKRLIEQPLRAEEMGARGKAIAESKFTEQAMMKNIVSAYDSILGASGK